MENLIVLMIFLPLLGAIGCLFQTRKENARYIALFTSIVTFAVSAIVGWAYYSSQVDAVGGAGAVQFEYSALWIKHLNVYFRTGVDGISMPLVILSTGVSILVVLAAFSIEKNVNMFMALYLMLLSGMLGVFLSLDMILFYVFFEISLLPMYFLIGIWGGPRREYAAIKFFLYTLAGSICLLITMMGLYFFTGEANGGTNTWAMVTSMKDTVSLQSEQVRALFAQDGPHWAFAQAAFWLTLIAFMVKLPAVPFHTWLPDAHVQAPTPISMILAGVLLKMGGYALMRITYPFFPDAAALFWYPVAALGVLAIVYGAFCALAQHLNAECDWKKLVAYSSVSHMGFVTLGLAVMNETAFNGAYYQMIGHGIGSALMFFLVGVVYERAHRRDMSSFKGLGLHWPNYGGWSMVGFFAGLGLPGLCGFIGEIMVFLGVFKASDGVGASNPTSVWVLGIIAATGVVLTAAYILWMIQRVYMGQPKEEYASFKPVTTRENVIMVSLGILAIVFGIFPALVFSLTDNTVAGLFKIFAASIGA